MEIELGAEERKARKYPREEEEHSNKKRGTKLRIRTAPFDMMEELHHMRGSGSPLGCRISVSNGGGTAGFAKVWRHRQISSSISRTRLVEK